MKNILKIISLLLVNLLTFNTHAQFTSTSSFETVSSGPNETEYKTVGATSSGRHIAISRQYIKFLGNNKGRRDLRFFDFGGNLLAQSEDYSHDNHFFTKILFDPRDENIVYALYVQRETHPYLSEPEEDAKRLTYLRRFVKNGSSVSMSDEFVVFYNDNPSDFVIAPNGDLLVGNVKDNGQVKILPVKWIGGLWLSATEWEVSYPGTATRSPTVGTNSGSLWPIFMDMKDYVFIIGHNRGYYYNSNEYSQIKKALYHPNNQTATPIQTYYLQGKPLYGSGSSSGSISSGMADSQSIALRTDGGIMFISNPPDVPANSYTGYLNSMTASGTITVLESVNGPKPRVVVTEQNKTFFASGSSTLQGTPPHISLYNSTNNLEHTYYPASEIKDHIYNLSVKDCKLLVTTDKINYGTYQHHQFFSCTDCNGNVTAAGEFKGQFMDREVWTKYGPLPVAVFCNPNDVIFNGVPSTCENKVEIAVAPININTWVPGQDLYSGVFCNNCTAPNNMQILNYASSLNYGQYYLFTFRVIDLAGNVSVIHRLFLIEYCEKSEGVSTESLIINIYPNPNQGIFNVSMTNNEKEGVLEVIDLSGNLIYKGTIFKENPTEIDISRKKSGTYIVKVSIEGEVFSEKIIKE
ncbi:T9SS type A sorting domain-containing protein [Tenacibaculum sp. FZY0031]|uniref:T9SS type A sorting domain-containing protein n=1 Tax=Tenacibaculum sp. FZY0031 TaxID=3116648 RepID=UPI002ECF372E|nr:T9SS type A sorting domain-containing protein [Tenacibaculum sp. FZY0031]